MRNPWTREEKALLRRVWPMKAKSDLIKLFPRHPWRSIKSTGYSLLGPKRPCPYGNKKWRDIAARHVPTFRFRMDTEEEIA